MSLTVSGFVPQNKKTVAARQKDLDKMAQRIQEVKEASEKDAADYTAAQKHFQAVSSGLSANDDGEAATLNEQLLGVYHCLFFFSGTGLPCLPVLFQCKSVYWAGVLWVLILLRGLLLVVAECEQ